jgi:alginate O-acetyltransferase complex protein AlgI
MNAATEHEHSEVADEDRTYATFMARHRWRREARQVGHRNFDTGSDGVGGRAPARSENHGHVVTVVAGSFRDDRCGRSGHLALFVHPRIVGNPHGRYLSVGLLLSAVGAPFTPIVVSNVLFPTVQFGIFFPIVFFLSWLLRPQPRLWKLFTIAASYIFYVFAFRGGWFTWEKWRFPALLGLVTVLNQVFVVGTFRSNGRARRFWVTIAVVFDLGVLGYFKYYNFFRDNLGPLLSWLPKRQVVLPVAISFYIFQALSYVIDAYRGKVKPARLIDFATYLSFFPHLVAGPIVRASEFLPQMRERPDPRHLDAGRAFRLVMAGMFKKVVVASYLAKASVDKVFASPKSYGAIDTLVSVYAYAVQIYCDFSGYTDIAIGLALLLGVRFPKNFESPYIATSLQSFWRRWHMSLSRWLRDYLYIPLGGNRGSNLPGLRGRITPRAATYLNLSLVMLLGGLWHGAAVRFLIWGAIHGLGLAFERMRADQRGQANDAAPERSRLLVGSSRSMWCVQPGSSSGPNHSAEPARCLRALLPDGAWVPRSLHRCCFWLSWECCSLSLFLNE